MYDKKRIDKHLFGFCESEPDSKYDNEIIKLLRLKYALKRKDILPFVEVLEREQQTDLFKQSDKELQIEIDGILKKDLHAKTIERKKGNKILKNIDSRRFTQPPEKNCCYHSLNQENEFASKSLRTQTIYNQTIVGGSDISQRNFDFDSQMKSGLSLKRSLYDNS